MFLAKQFFDVAYLLSKEIELSSQALNVRSGAAVHVEIEFTAQAVLRILAILAHHDDGRLDSGQQRKEEIEKNEGIGIPGGLSQKYVHHRIDAAHDCKGDDKRPGAAELTDRIGDAFAKGGFLFDDFIGMRTG